MINFQMLQRRCGIFAKMVTELLIRGTLWQGSFLGTWNKRRGVLHNAQVPTWIPGKESDCMPSVMIALAGC